MHYLNRMRAQRLVYCNAASQSIIGIVPAFTDTGTSPYYTLGAHFFGGVRRIFVPLSIADAHGRTLIYCLLSSRSAPAGHVGAAHARIPTQTHRSISYWAGP